MGEKKLVPKRRFSGFDEEWIENKLGDIIEITMGHSPQSSNYTNNSSDYILVQGNADIHRNKVCPRVWTTQLTKQANKEDLIMTVRAPVGEIAKTDFNVVLGRGVAGLKGNDFIFYSLVKKKLDGYWTRLSTGSTFDSVNSYEIKDVDLLMPTEKEQQKIGELFTILDERIANQERKIAKVKALKDAYLTEMFPQEGETVPKRRFKGFEEEWKGIDLGSIGSTFSGLSGKTKKDFGHGSAEFVTYMNVFNNTISDINNTERVIHENKETQLKYGDILFTTSSETPDEVGMSSVWLNDRPNVYLNSFCFGFRSNIKIDYYFVGYLLRANEFRRKIEILAQGISRYNISKSKVMELKVNLPSIKEQQKIGSFFKNLDNQIEMEEKKLDKLQKMKEAYLEE